MTQQPYYPPQQPAQQYPPQYPQAPQQPAPPNQTYPPQQQPYAQPMPPQYGGAPQGYPAQAPPQGPPAQPLAPSTIDDFYNQPSAGSGPAIGWTDEGNQQRPIGTTWIGVVARDVTNADIEQSTDIRTGVPQTFRDGSPKRHMKVPLKQVALFDPQGNQLPTPKLTEGEGTWFCKGQARDELVRAMAEAGDSGAPKGEAVIRITLVNRRPSGAGMNPANIVQISYQPAAGQGAQPTPAPAQPAPQAQPVQQAPAQPVQQQAPQGYPQQAPAPGQYAPPVQQQQAPQQAPQQVPVGGVQAPPNMDPAQQELWNRITGGQQTGQPQGQPAA